MKKLLHTKEKGFTLLFAVLVATLVVSIGASIISIALRQTILSGTSRESQYAFYAANTILECAFYWDITNSRVFQSSDADDTIAPSDTEAQTITCGGISILNGNKWEPTNNETLFQIEIEDKSSDPVTNIKHCAEAVVTKTINPDDSITTRIDAKGYNTDCSNLNSPRTVERGLVQEYRS